MTAQDIMACLTAAHNDNVYQRNGYVHFGIRTTNEAAKVGEMLTNSHDWDHANDCFSGQYLPGASCTTLGYLWFDGGSDDIETVEAALATNSNYLGIYQYLVVGDSYASGDDVDETILRNPTVIGVIR